MAPLALLHAPSIIARRDRVARTLSTRAASSRGGPAVVVARARADPPDPSLRHRVAASAALAAVTLSLTAPGAALAKLVNVAIDPETLTTRVCADPRAGGVPGTATFKAQCMEIVGVATNPTKDAVFNADVYGSVKDAANEDVLNSGRVGSIAELKPGANEFTLRLTVATSQPLPLKLKNFKAQGATQKLNASPNPYEDYTEFDDFGAQK